MCLSSGLIFAPPTASTTGFVSNVESKATFAQIAPPSKHYGASQDTKDPRHPAIGFTDWEHSEKDKIKLQREYKVD